MVRLLLLNGLIWYENQIEFSVRADTSISERWNSVHIFCCYCAVSYFGRCHHSLVNENFKPQHNGGIQVSIEILYLHFVIVNARAVFVLHIDITVVVDVVPMGKRFYTI